MSTPMLRKVDDGAGRRPAPLASAMLDQLPCAVYATDTEGRLTYFNEAAVRFSGRRPELGTDRWCVSWKLYHADGTPMPHGACPMAVTLKEQREVTGLEAIAERPDGTRVPFMPYPSLLRDDRGRIVGAMNMLVELTESKQAKQALRASEERYDRLLSLLPAAVYTCNAPSGEITYFNERAAELWGRRPALGTPDERFCGSFRLWWPDGRPLAHQDTPMALALREGTASRNVEAIIERPDGSRVSALVNIDPIRDGSGNVTGAVNVFIDTTRLKETERELVRRTRQLATFLDTAAVGLHRVGSDGKILWANDAELAMLGYGRDEYVGRHISDFHVDGHVLDDILLRLRKGEKLRDYEARLRARDGTIRTVQLDSSVYWEDGKFAHTQCFTRDVTERKRSEEAIAGLAAIVDSSEDAIVGMALDGTIVSWNRAAERIYGYCAAEVVGRHISVIVPPERQAEEDDVLSRLRRGERIESFETERRRKDGVNVPISLTASAVRDKSGRIIGMSKIGRDITERKTAEAALREADRRKDEFLASLAHELRNPLAPIRSGLELLAMSSGKEDGARQTLDIMDRQLGQLVRLIDDLLDIGRITTGKVTIKRERLELQAALQSAVEMVQPLAKERGQRIETTLPGEPVYVVGDAVRLTQVFSNLLNNALKFSAPGSAVQLDAGCSGSAIEVRVADRGLGIPPALLSHVFEPFVQLDASRPTQNTGLGIGLTLVRRFVELHGGRVEAASEGLGKGSTFTVHLEAAAPAAASGASPSRPDIRAAKRRRILVVDDNRDAVTSLAAVLELVGHEVHVAYDGMQALEKVRLLAPEVVILDIGLPRMNGYEVCAQIKRSAGASPKVVALTGWGQETDRRRSAEAGFDEHLVKPVDFDVLAGILA